MFRACFAHEPKAKVSAVEFVDDSYESVRGEPLLPRSKFDDKSKRRVLLEIVGSIGLSLVKDDIDSFCIVKIGDKEIHRTTTILNDTSPIWTIKTKSLCMLELEPDQGVTIELCYSQSIVSTKRVSKVISSKKVVGGVALCHARLLEGKGERQEFGLIPQEPSVTLALRFREATKPDFMHFNDISSRIMYDKSRSNFIDHAADTDFKNVSSKNFLVKHQKTVVINETKQKAFRVWPFPDPDNPDETRFMTKEQIHNAARQPSKQWVEGGCGGCGDYGTVHLEILGCDDLPNMDTEYVTGLTDAFAACLFEDTYVRSSVIHDSLNPRWVPWSHRAFMFHIQHPSSILFLGVFDYDEGPLEYHDPIGRVVIHLDSFEHDTVYTLKYPLYHGDTQAEEHRGTITVRLRIHWNNTAEVSKAQSYVRPPRFIINAKTTQSWRILRYLTRGSVDMTEVTVASVKLYFSEIISYWRKYCYLLDVLAGILLWRGRANITFLGMDFSVWFPIHSALLFIAVVLGLERPELLPSIVLYTMTHALLVNNYYLSRHPSPCSRVRSFRRIISDSRSPPFGSSSSRVHIAPETGIEEEKTLDLLDEYKMHRVTGFIYEFLMTGLKVYQVYSKSTPVDISTVSKSGSLFAKLYVDYLYHAHTVLRLLCNYIRVLRNFVNWKVHTTYKFTMDLLVLATFWCFFPFKHWALWAIRILVWTCFGPWVKLIDVFYLRKYYRTKEDLLRDGIPETTEEMKEDIASRPSILDPLLKSSWVRKMGKSGRIVVEDNIKLRDFRAEQYGTYSERVPTVDTSRFPSIPLSSSFAQPYGPAYCDSDDEDYQDLPPGDQTWSYVPGQKLAGHMIPQATIRATMAETKGLRRDAY